MMSTLWKNGKKCELSMTKKKLYTKLITDEETNDKPMTVTFSMLSPAENLPLPDVWYGVGAPK